jgi:hypothetical protein
VTAALAAPAADIVRELGYAGLVTNPRRGFTNTRSGTMFPRRNLELISLDLTRRHREHG